MADYTAFNYTDDFYVKAPITFEMMRALAENPQAIAEGAAGAPRISIDVGGQKALATAETDTTKRLAPNGSGGVQWLSTSGDFKVTTSSATSLDRTSSALNTGLWHIQAQAAPVGDGASNAIGSCWLLNGTIIRQMSVSTFAPGGGLQMQDAFSVSGSGSGKTLKFDAINFYGGVAHIQMMGVRVI